jgi:chromosome segregation ATPase
MTNEVRQQMASYLRDTVKLSFKPGADHADRVYEAASTLEQQAATISALEARVGEFTAYGERMAREREQFLNERDAALSKLAAAEGRVQRLNRSVRDAAEILLVLNKEMHERNPMAVTAIDEWLAECALRAEGSLPTDSLPMAPEKLL